MKVFAHLALLALLFPALAVNQDNTTSNAPSTTNITATTVTSIPISDTPTITSPTTTETTTSTTTNTTATTETTTSTTTNTTATTETTTSTTTNTTATTETTASTTTNTTATTETTASTTTNTTATTETTASTATNTTATTETTASTATNTTATTETTASTATNTTATTETTASTATNTTATTETTASTATNTTATTETTASTATNTTATTETTTSTTTNTTATTETTASTTTNTTATTDTTTSTATNTTATTETTASTATNTTATTDTTTSTTTNTTATTETTTSTTTNTTATTDTTTSTATNTTATTETTASTATNTTATTETTASTTTNTTATTDTTTSTATNTTATIESTTPNTATSTPTSPAGGTIPAPSLNLSASTIRTPGPSTPCKEDSCKDGSLCVNLLNDYFCLCSQGYYYNSSTCNRGKIFPGTIKVKISYTPELENKTSEAYRNLYFQVTTFFKDTFNNSEYGQTVIVKVSTSTSARSEMRADNQGVDVEVVNIFTESTKENETTISNAITKAIGAQSRNFSGYDQQDRCDYYGCKKPNDQNGCDDGLLCECKDRLVRPNPQVPVCVALGATCSDTCNAQSKKQCLVMNSTDAHCVCLPGYKEDSQGKCQECPFGYSGIDCEDSFQLILTIVGTIAGIVILGMVIALIVSMRLKNKGMNVEEETLIEKDSRNLRLKETGFSNLGAEGSIFPKIKVNLPRDNQPENPYTRIL